MTTGPFQSGSVPFWNCHLQIHRAVWRLHHHGVSSIASLHGMIDICNDHVTECTKRYLQNTVTGTRNMHSYHRTIPYHGYHTTTPCCVITQVCRLSTCVTCLTHAVVLKVAAMKRICSWILHCQWTPSCVSRSFEHVGCWQLSTRPASGWGEVQPPLHPSLPCQCHVTSHLCSHGRH